GTATFVLFDQDAIVLLNKSYADLIESHNQIQMKVLCQSQLLT
ncbi:hypothetical protein A2U01_0097244, partial [Trifolium medium]|nr:hypothetical protein [Trifolium medium]